MHRPAAALLCSLAAFAATAAPAPPPKAWLAVGGWGRPVTPAGCRVERKGDKLTITLRRTDPAPTDGKLLREVTGDFVAEVRLLPEFRPADLRRQTGQRCA